MSKQPTVFWRSARGELNKLKEIIKVLEYSLIMVEYFGLKEFNNVIAVQLRILLCDTAKKNEKIVDNSLVKKVYDDPRLYPISNDLIKLDEGTAFIPKHTMFDYSSRAIELDKWLEQVIYQISFNEKVHKFTIKDFIKYASNKSGGAHVDSELVEKAFIVDVHLDQVIPAIGKGVLKSLTSDFDNRIVENLEHMLTIIAKKLDAQN